MDRASCPPPSLPPSSAPSPELPVSGAEDAALGARYEEVISRISLKLKQGGYVAEQCSMLVEIAQISAAANCPEALRNQAMEMLLVLGRRRDEESPCTRGVREFVEQCLARGIVR